jgi:hypothetical protein
MKSISFLLFFIICASQLLAQEERRCSFTSTPEEKKRNSYFYDYQDKLNQEIEKRKKIEGFARTEADIFTIPIIVHVIHNGEPIGTGTNISAAQIQSQIDVLNEDFSNNNPYKNTTVAQFRDRADDAGIRFVLADLDPNGNILREKGIDRVRFPKRNRPWTDVEFDTERKPQTIWDPSKYLNIWTADTTIVVGGQVLLGYATYPNLSGLEGIPQEAVGTSSTDGLVVRYNRFGSAGKINVPQLPKGSFTFGRTATHEIGHFFGLLHTFNSFDCAVDGDYCPDTPLISSESSGCSLNQMRCNTLSMVQNYMDYSRDTCMTLFTKDQIRRMRTVLQVSPSRVALTKSNVVSFVDKLLSSQIVVYPNPSQTQIRVVVSNIKLKEYKIYTLQGQQVSSQKFDEFTEVIDVSALDVGVYLLQIETQKGVAIKKIMIQR